jgi:3-phytase
LSPPPLTNNNKPSTNPPIPSLFEITPNGTLTTIPGGSQPTPPDYEVYGSCTYRSPTTGKQYLFVNAKSAQYLQYELSATADGTLTTTLVRSFTAGSGGQVEGCVSDEANGVVFIGEEPHALWRYDAEPAAGETPEGVAVATVGDGHLRADVEGVALVVGKTKEEGFIVVSNQGVSAYNVYRRQAPHEFVMAFTIGAAAGVGVDAVTNTDGVAAVGTSLGAKFPKGLVVVHDDANELAGGGTSEEASFKLVPLERILGAEVVKGLGLLDQVDSDWDPRA